MPVDASNEISISPALRLQPRDYDLLRGLFECRVMTLPQVATLFFDGLLPAATKRIQTLKAGGYISDARRRIGERSILSLTKKSFGALTSAGKLDGFPHLTPEQFAKRARVSELSLEHELSVIDVKVAIHRAMTANANSHRIEHFTTWPALSEFSVIHPDKREQVPVRPDGFLHVSEHGGDGAVADHRFFLELDRSNESQTVLTNKILCYRAHYAAGGFALRCGGKAEEFREYPFRVLVILLTDERRNNTAERLLNCFPPLKFQAWLSTLPEVLADPLGQIWSCPQDYTLATQGTEYEPHRRRDIASYIRRPERERLVKERLVKRTLFDYAV